MRNFTLLTQAEFDQVREELEALRGEVVDELKIMRLEQLLASATVIDHAGAPDGTAGLGCVVQVEERAGRRAEYELVGVRSADAGRLQVTPGSPLGQALLGARAGDTVQVTLPNGRARSLKVLAVRSQAPADRQIA